MRIYKTGYVLSLEEERQTLRNHLRRKTRTCYKSRTIDDISRLGSPYYKYIASPSDTCGNCAALHGMAFHFADASEGINLPPLHPNCKCEIEPYNFEDELPANWGINDNPGGISLDDWVFFGRSGMNLMRTQI